MDCHANRVLIHGYADGELDLAATLEVERHLRECPSCAEEWASLEALSAALRNPALYHAMPDGLVERTAASIGGASPIASAARVPAWRWAALAASVLVLVSFAWGLRGPRSGSARLADEVVRSHVRSLLAEHLTDVRSTDRHTVLPWFAGRLDFAPPVEDLAAEGFPLVGGRLDYLDDRPVAALVYRRRRHVINLFAWPAVRSEDAERLEIHGFNVLHWNSDGMTFWAVSDAGEGDLEALRRIFERARGRGIAAPGASDDEKGTRGAE